MNADHVTLSHDLHFIVRLTRKARQPSGLLVFVQDDWNLPWLKWHKVLFFGWTLEHHVLLYITLLLPVYMICYQISPSDITFWTVLGNPTILYRLTMKTLIRLVSTNLVSVFNDCYIHRLDESVVSVVVDCIIIMFELQLHINEFPKRVQSANLQTFLTHVKILTCTDIRGCRSTSPHAPAVISLCDLFLLLRCIGLCRLWRFLNCFIFSLQSKDFSKRWRFVPL